MQMSFIHTQHSSKMVPPFSHCLVQTNIYSTFQYNPLLYICTCIFLFLYFSIPSSEEALRPYLDPLWIIKNWFIDTNFKNWFLKKLGREVWSPDSKKTYTHSLSLMTCVPSFILGNKGMRETWRK
jgi:hypothetical protein